MKTHYRLLVLLFATVFSFSFSGCMVTVGDGPGMTFAPCKVLYGRSGIFVQNNTRFKMELVTNNNQWKVILPGERAQLLTVGLFNGQKLTATANFYHHGTYIGYSQRIWKVNYNGGSFVRRWEPQLEFIEEGILPDYLEGLERER